MSEDFRELGQEKLKSEELEIVFRSLLCNNILYSELSTLATGLAGLATVYVR
jgi:hypothetical protein